MKKDTRGKSARLNKLANSWTAEPPLVQARARSCGLTQWPTYLVTQNDAQLLFDLFLQGKGIEASQELFQLGNLGRIGFGRSFQAVKGSGRSVIDAPLTTALDLGAQVLHHWAE